MMRGSIRKQIRVLAVLALLAAPCGILGRTKAQNTAYPEMPGMSLIPAGDFWMGRVHFFPHDEFGFVQRDRLDDRPAHKVDIDAFYMDKYEVTNEDYKRFTDETRRAKPWYWPSGNIAKGEERFPVSNVTWNDASAYCKWAGKRLPSEAEWEKAARGGLDRQMYPWGSTGITIKPPEGAVEGQREGRGARLPKHAHVQADAIGPARVGLYPPNGFGLYDVAGNVWEWTNDWYLRDYYSISPDRNPTGPESGKYRVIRGGGWSDEDITVMVNYRNYTDPDQKSSTIGFRCAKSGQ